MTPFIDDTDFTLWVGHVLDVLGQLGDGEADACVTSPPYLDARPEYGTLTPVEWRRFFRELRRVVAGPALLNCGRLWRNGVESDWHQRLIRTARLEGWEKLDELVWVKPNANPIHGKVIANSHEYIFVLGTPATVLNTDAIRTEYDAESLARFQRRYRNGVGVKGEVREQDGREANTGGARARSFLIEYIGGEKGNDHPAPMPLRVAEHLVALASFPGQTILDPFLGSGTTALAARRLGRRVVGVELDQGFAEIAAERLSQQSLLA